MPSIFACLHFIVTQYTCSLMVLQKRCQENFINFQEFSESRFVGSEKDIYLLKILKLQHKLVWDYKQGKLISYFLNNASKICLNGLKKFKEHWNWACFSAQRIFHLSSNLHTSCFSAFNVFSLLISRASRTFFLYMFDITGIVLGWIQLSCPWHSLVCSIAPDDSQLLFMLSCWCSIHHVNTIFFDSLMYVPLHEQSNWYTSWWLLGSSFGLFWQRMPCKLLLDLKVISLLTFLNSFLIVDSKLGTHGVSFELL